MADSRDIKIGVTHAKSTAVSRFSGFSPTEIAEIEPRVKQDKIMTYGLMGGHG